MFALRHSLMTVVFALLFAQHLEKLLRKVGINRTTPIGVLETRIGHDLARFAMLAQPQYFDCRQFLHNVRLQLPIGESHQSMFLLESYHLFP